MIRFIPPLCILASLAAVVLAHADSPPSTETSNAPVILPTVNVWESVLNLKVRTEFAQFGNGTAFATRMTVDSVKAGSIAEKAGLKPGVEIIAIQGRHVAGLNPSAIQELMDEPVKDALLLLVKKGFFKKSEEVRLPLPATPSDPAQEDPK